MRARTAHAAGVLTMIAENRARTRVAYFSAQFTAVSVDTDGAAAGDAPGAGIVFPAASVS
jgi:hypothetical protein